MRRFLVLILFAFVAACTAAPTEVPVRVLPGWQPQIDLLTGQDSARAWRFNGQQGDAVRLRLAAKASGQVTLLLQDEQGHTLAQGSDLDVTLPASGIYTALVRLNAGAGTTYSLSLSYSDRAIPTATPTYTPTPTATRTPTPTFTPSNTPTPTRTPTPVYAALGTLNGYLQSGVTIEGSYLSVYERHIYIFSGMADQRITITLTGLAGTLAPTLTLFDPSGQSIAENQSNGGQSASLRDVALAVDGDYIVQALGGGTGDYRISLQAETPDTATPET